MTLIDPLKSRELEVLRLMAEGLSNREIADQLFIGTETVKWHAKNIYSKLDVSNRKEAAKKADALGLLVDDAPQDRFYERVYHNLPEVPTPFIGRVDDIVQLHDLLLNEDKRLVTILAPGGMGKTRLSMEVGRRQLNHHIDGVYFVPLAPLSSAQDIVTTIAESICLVFHGGGNPVEQIVDFLRDRSMLLVLDNFEHLLDGVTLLSTLLKATSTVKFLVTSRERLNIQGEHVYHLGGMDFPAWETPEDAYDYDSVKLFMQSAVRNRNDFELHAGELDYLARICKLTAGMPLGIELAAGWVDVLSLEQIAGEIQQGIDIFETEMRDLPERHRSLRATFERTWDRLTDAEQDIFMKLSVFRGGFTLEAAQEIAGAGIRDLRKLAQKALIQVDGHERYAIHELVRQFGAMKLDESDSFEAIRARHTDYYTQFMREQEQNFKSGKQLKGLTLIDPDFENVRVAWYALIEQQDWEGLTAFRYSFWFYCTMRSRGQDIVKMCDDVLEALQRLPESDLIKRTTGRMLSWSGWFYFDLGDIERGGRFSYDAISILEALDDQSEDLIIAYFTISRIEIFHSYDVEKGFAFARRNQQLARLVGDPTWLGLTATYAAFLGDYSKVDSIIAEARHWFEQTGDQHGLWVCYTVECQKLIHNKQYRKVHEIQKYSQTLIEPFSSAWHLSLTDKLLGITAILMGDWETGRYYYRHAIRRLWESGYTYAIYVCLKRIAQSYILEDKLEDAMPLMRCLEDVTPELRDLNYNLDKRADYELSYEDLKQEFEQKLAATRQDHLWQSTSPQPLNQLVHNILGKQK